MKRIRITGGNITEEASEDDDEDQNTAEAEAEFYKEKLIKLARAHATLLTLVGDGAGHSVGGGSEAGAFSGKSNGDRHAPPPTESEEQDEEALISHSQLSAMSGDEDIGESQDTAMSTVLVSPPKQAQQSEVGTGGGSRPRMHRMESIQSQRSLFAGLIADSGDVLGSLPELEAWLDIEAVGYGSQEMGEAGENSQEMLERAGLLSQSFGVGAGSLSQDVATAQLQPLEMTAGAGTAGVARGAAAAGGGNGRTENAAETRREASAPTHVRVGVGVLVKDPQNPRKVFAGIRRGSHGSGTLALPGGHLEMNETWDECATREVEEETGLRIQNATFAHVTNDPMPASRKHYITIFMKAECMDESARAPQNLEPNKCEGWSSYSWDELRDIYNGGREDVRLFGPLRHLVAEEPPIVREFLN